MPKPKKAENKQDYLARCTQELIDKEGKEPDQAFATCNAYWDDSKSQRSAMNLTAPLTLAPAGDETLAKGFLITAYTGAILDTWWGKVIINTAGIKVNAKIPVLREHVRDQVVGYSIKAWIEGRNLLIQGDFSARTQAGQEVQALAVEGFPWQASIGVWPQKIKVLGSDKESETVNGQEIKGPVEIWMESRVREVSFCALGADDETAAITLADNYKKVPVIIDRPGPNIEEVQSMAEITLKQLEAEAPGLLNEIRESARTEGQAAGREEGIKNERARVMEILEADGDAATAREAIKEGLSAPETFKRFFEAEKVKRGEALTALEKQAPAPLGQAIPKPPEKNSDKPADQTLAAMAQELAHKEKIDLAEAQQRVFADPANAELVKQWQPGGIH